MEVIRLSPDGRELRSLLTGAALWGLSDPPAGGPVPAAQRKSGHRRLLGITGAPGAGKSTLAAAVASLVDGAVVVPMDGFHLADVELDRRGLRDRKGAPETFDAWGYAALLARLRDETDHTVMAPAFERTLEQPLGSAIPVPPEATLVVTEGNYLLLDSPEWEAARRRLDAVWFVHTAEAVRVERLVARHEEFGKSAEDARAWVESVDQPNARRVEACAARADVRLDVGGWRPPSRGGEAEGYLGGIRMPPSTRTTSPFM